MAPGFIDRFCDLPLAHLKPVVDLDETEAILADFKRLRMTDETVDRRIASINRSDGMNGTTFSCDGARYVDHKTFFDKLDTFATPCGT